MLLLILIENKLKKRIMNTVHKSIFNVYIYNNNVYFSLIKMLHLVTILLLLMKVIILYT